MKTQRNDLVIWTDRYFYFFMTLLVAAIVVYGFSHTIGRDYLHATPVRPFILTIHIFFFSGWVLFFILQSALIRIHKVSLHQTLGWIGVALGIGVIVFGYLTAIIMDRFLIVHFNNTTIPPLLLAQLASLTEFAIFFVMAVYLRSRPEYHRRLMVLATCVLMFQAFTRFPHLPLVGASGGVDVLVLLGMFRDLVVDHRVHKVYLYALALLICFQIVDRELRAHATHWLAHITNSMVR